MVQGKERMRPPSAERDPQKPALISRRQILKSGIVVAGSIYLSGCDKTNSSSPETVGATSPSYILSREADELFLEVKAIGYREVTSLRRRRLERIKGFANPLLVFKFPPQHFAETAIKMTPLPLTLAENMLSAIALYPSRPSTLVFRVPDRERLDLNLKELLAWDTFELVLPNLNRSGSLYDLDVPDVDGQSFSRIEMPWGIDLTPLGVYGRAPAGLEANADTSFLWRHSIEPISSGNWIELWTTALQNSQRPDLPNQFEVLGVRGFQRGSITGSAEVGDLVVTYSDSLGEDVPDWLGNAADDGRTATVRNLDRIEIAASLSRRFKYTGKPKQSDTGRIKYVSRFNPPSSDPATCSTGPAVSFPEGKSIPVCYEDGRTIPVEQFRLSSRGGWLELDSSWSVDPGCGLKGWKHSSSLGRDHRVELVRAGFLFPFGIEAELITLSERAFVKDEQGHFVAVLLQQDFLQIPQPNSVDLAQSESIFRSLSITTKRTPPLDAGNHSDLDFFTPTVAGQPFEFEHVGIDWAGDAHTSKMPMFFVANTVRSSNGLIWEPGYDDKFFPKPNRPQCGGLIPPDGDGLRVVDQKWNAEAFRFAQYGDSLITLAKPLANGDTSQRVEWVEWTRGNVWAIPVIKDVFTRPFLPRARTMKVRLQGMTQFSGGNTFSLATFRDTRFTTFPLLDPEPNAKPPIYNTNIPQDPTDGSSAYLFLLETRDLINESGPPVPDPSPQVTRQRIRAIYYGTSSNPNPIPDSLFESINNEVQFGISASSDSTGGLSVPDTHTSTLTRRFGPVGDASFNARRWTAYDANHKAKLEAARRLDYAAFRIKFRKELDKQPFEKSGTQADINVLVTEANNLMQFAPLPSDVSLVASSDQIALAATPGSMPGLKLGDLFGKDAQLLPGISFMDIFQEIAMRNTSGTEDLNIADASESAADPMQWNFRITGIDWIMKLIGTGPGQISFADLLQIAKTEGQSMSTSKPIDFGVEASLQWTNKAFKPVCLSFVKFIPIKPKGDDRETDDCKTRVEPDRETRLELEARASMSLGLTGLPASLSDLKIDPGKAQITSRAEFKDFIVSIFNAIEVEFESVSFTMSADGRKDFQTKIRDVQLIGLLEFINQLSKVFGKIGDLGMDMDISLTRVRISQTIRFPPKEGKPLVVGTAQIINLAFSWGVMIPLTGRDVLTVSFALSSREKPMIIFVPSWYGGKAHILLEVTTKGLRMIEVSMEYGALVATAWGVANGVASLTAGVFYMMKRTLDPHGNTTSVDVVFKAFVKAAADLDVAGIIHCSGLYMIALSYDPKTGELKGEAIQSVSVKIGFIRYGYSFSATHSEKKAQDSQALLSQPATNESIRGGPSEGNSFGVDQTTTNPCSPSIPRGDLAVAVQIFGPNLTKEKRDAFEKIIDGYLM
jgi:hypothetical protein